MKVGGCILFIGMAELLVALVYLRGSAGVAAEIETPSMKDNAREPSSGPSHLSQQEKVTELQAPSEQPSM